MDFIDIAAEEVIRVQLHLDALAGPVGRSWIGRLAKVPMAAELSVLVARDTAQAVLIQTLSGSAFKMKPTRPSTTAEWTVFMRALGDIGTTSVKQFADPLAKQLLSKRFLVAYRIARLFNRRCLDRLLRRWVSPMVDLLTLRTLAIDDLLRTALCELEESVVKQVVVLGAGFDARPFRLTSLHDVSVYEVDHPATQIVKRSRLGQREPLSRSITFVPVDLTLNSLEDSMNQSGFDCGERSVWIWEGVIMYLDQLTFDSTLRAIAAFANPSSRLIAHYREPSTAEHRALRQMQLIARRSHEPQIGIRSRAAIHQSIERAGFCIVLDEGADEWVRRYEADRCSEWVRATRIVVADRACCGTSAIHDRPIPNLFTGESAPTLFARAGIAN